MKPIFQLPNQPLAADRAEVELLLCCARTQILLETAERIRNLIQEDIDWGDLIQTAACHQVLPLLYQSLEFTCPEAVPKPILAQLKDFFSANASHNQLLTCELLKLLNLFEEHSILAIPFKGPVLAVSAYENLALRQFCDLDIIVDKPDVPEAKELLLNQGYRLQKDLGWEYHFVSENGQINVDLHQSLVPAYFNLRLDFKRLRSRLKPLSIAGTMVPNILPESLLLLLCVQLGKDCCHWNVRLIQLCDVAELLRTHPKLDWFWVLGQAQELGCERMLLLDFFLIGELFGASLPGEVLERLEADSVSKSLAKQVSSRLWREADDPSEEPGLWSFFWSYNHRFYLSMRECQRDIVIYCLHWLRTGLYAALRPNEADWILLRLPKVFSFLYYPLHVMRLIVKHVIKPVLCQIKENCFPKS